MEMSRDELAATIRRVTTPDVAAAMIQSILPAARLSAARGRTGVPVSGRTRFGGYPDLPDGVPWPSVSADTEPTWRLLRRLEASGPAAYPSADQWHADVSTLRDKLALGGQPLTFLAQVDLTALPPTGLQLPTAGLLLFFYDTDGQPWGMDRADREHWRVLHVPVGRPAVRPAGGYDHRAPFRECDVRTIPIHTVATRLPDSAAVESDRYARAVRALCEVHPDEGPAHWFGGHPIPVQDDVFHDPVTHADLGSVGPADWALLLQLDSDEDGPGWTWGDSGRLYFCIRRRDAERADFSRVWCVLQCG